MQDERGVYKNLLQETAHRAGLSLPVYTAIRSGPGHVPVFSCTVELAGMTFTGQPAKTKKQAQKNAAMAAWSSLKQMSQSGSSSSSSSTSSGCHEEQDKVIVARFLSSLNPAESSNSPQNNQQKGEHQHNRSPTTSRNSFPSTTTSFRPRYPNWASSNLSPEMGIHYMWMQEQAAEQQRRLMALPIGIPPPNQLFPWMHSMLHPSHHHHPYTLTDQQPFSLSPGVAIGTSNSSFHPPNRKMVTIQEIKEEKPDNSCNLSPPEATTSAALLTDEKLQKEDKQDSFSSTHKIPLETHVENGSGLQNPVGLLSSRPNVRHAPTASHHGQEGVHFLSPTHPAPPRPTQKTFRIAVNGPRMPGRVQVRGSQAPFMAQAVQIRSVVPVFSAAPRRATMNPIQESPPSDEKRSGTPGEISIMNSKMGNLHI